MSDPIEKELRHLLVRRLCELRDAGKLTTEDVVAAASLAGVSTRTIRRWVAARRPPTYEQPRYVASKRDLDAFTEANGRYARAWEKRRAEDPTVPPPSTWRRALIGATSVLERTYARGGARAARDESVYLPAETAHRNEIWEIDHKELDVWVLPRRGDRPQRPWMTSVLDWRTRSIMGFALGLQGDTSTIVAAIHRSVEHDPTLGPFCGVPERLHYDNGRDFLSKAVEQVTDLLQVVGVALDPYAPQKKGKVERFHKTLVDQFLSQQPFFTGGPRTRANRNYWPDADPPLITDFMVDLSRYVNSYNCERTHSALGCTPLAAWEADTAPVRQLASAELAFLLPHKQRKVSKQGVHFDGVTFLAPELAALGGEQIEARYRPHDLRAIYVFFEGEYVCTAIPAEDLSPEDRKRFLQTRRRHLNEAVGRRRKATARNRARLAPLTKPGQPAADTQVLTGQDKERSRRRGSSGPKLSPRARKLLGLD